MPNNRIITYAIHSEGEVWSRVGDEVALPVLDFKGMTPQNNFAASYDLEKEDVLRIRSDWNYLRWTKKVPVFAKNLHREFWGFPLLPMTRKERQAFNALKRVVRNEPPAAAPAGA
jgi:hypothetical protein